MKVIAGGSEDKEEGVVVVGMISGVNDGGVSLAEETRAANGALVFDEDGAFGAE